MKYLYRYIYHSLFRKEIGGLNRQNFTKWLPAVFFVFVLALSSCKTCKCPAYSYDAKPEVMERAEGLAIAGGLMEDEKKLKR